MKLFLFEHVSVYTVFMLLKADASDFLFIHPTKNRTLQLLSRVENSKGGRGLDLAVLCRHWAKQIFSWSGVHDGLRKKTERSFALSWEHQF